MAGELDDGSVFRIVHWLRYLKLERLLGNWESHGRSSSRSQVHGSFFCPCELSDLASRSPSPCQTHAKEGRGGGGRVGYQASLAADAGPITTVVAVVVVVEWLSCCGLVVERWLSSVIPHLSPCTPLLPLAGVLCGVFPGPDSCRVLVWGGSLAPPAPLAQTWLVEQRGRVEQMVRAAKPWPPSGT